MNASVDALELRSDDEDVESLRDRLAAAEADADARRRQVELVAAVGHALVARGTFEEQLQGIVEAIERVVDASIVEVWLLDTARKRLHVAARAGRSHATAAADAPLDGSPLARSLADPKGFLFARDESTAFAGLPLVVEAEPWGVVCVTASESAVRAVFEALRTIADQLSVALGRNRARREGDRLLALVAQGEQREAAQKIAEQESLRTLAADLERRVVERTRALEEINRELEAFSYSVSHDLRAPIRHISGFAEMLERHSGKDLDDRGRHYLNTIASAAKQAGALIDDLLSFARVGRTEVVRREVDLDELTAACRRELVAEADPGRAVAWQIAKLPVVVGDPAMLRVVMRNLLSNAMKYTRKTSAPRIEVGLRERADVDGGAGEIEVFVRDNGVGFDMKHAHKLFGVFQRLHRSDEFEGTGIGLASVRRIIQRHGGRTSAEGTPGAGATFTFTLPHATIRRGTP